MNPYYPVGFADKFGAASLGKKRADTMARSGSLIRHNIHFFLHSDAPAGPLYLAWAAVNRQTLDDNVVAPEQRISVDDALRGVTIEAAYSWRKENEMGSIAAGKIANFTVLEQDPYKVKPLALKDIPIRATVFEGRVFPIAPRAKKVAGGVSPLVTAFAEPIAFSGMPQASGDVCDANRSLLTALAKVEQEEMHDGEVVLTQ